MPSESTVDRFIESSSRLLSAYPTTTTLSITYANALKKSKTNKEGTKKEDDADSKKATNIVTFKCYEPNAGKCIKYSTYKVKELSRLLTFVGPRGVSVTKPINKKRKLEDSDENSDKKTKTEKTSSAEHAAGLASIMSNVKFEEETVAKFSTPQPEEAASSAANSTATTTSASKKKNKKKKGKK
ncbi:signal recognition particle subunit Srp21p [[Candida] railenensis]|uniref:Signal recognition particle subunit Srp21p n=1 Tax=[Candida] railenensis TaxID=45579 RepID=A0A9P0VXI9_9ASCO|nr:signal recognition particle subunit Srp21p [[Candida] railenensis]